VGLEDSTAAELAGAVEMAEKTELGAGTLAFELELAGDGN
jgi:hypothetical protein